jgi:UDPglucose--hexose-1-phosphate uridylyltransferase
VIVQVGAVKVVPHPVPAFVLEADPTPRAVAEGAVEREGFGAHELVWGSHVESESLLVRMVAARVNDLRKDRRLRGFRAFRRHAAGHHAVWQLVALPWDLAPDTPALWRDQELAQGHRLLESSSDVASVLAWAPRTPFETWVMPVRGTARFAEEDPAPVAAAAARALSRIARALGGRGDAPEIDLIVVDGHPWRIELVPRIGGDALLQSATGIAVHGVSPEAAAAYLHETGERT